MAAVPNYLAAIAKVSDQADEARLHALWHRDHPGAAAVCGVTVTMFAHGPGGVLRVNYDPDHPKACPGCRRALNGGS